MNDVTDTLDEKYDSVEIDAPAGSFWFPSIYRPFTLGDRVKYGIAFPYALIVDLASSLNLRLSTRATPDPDNPILAVRAQSNIAPEVLPVGAGWERGRLHMNLLRCALEEFDARNLPRDRVFHGRDLRLTVRPFYYHARLSTGDRKGHTMLLERVMVRMDQPGTHDYI